MSTRFRPSLFERALEIAFVIFAVAASVELVRRSIPMYLPRDWARAHEQDAIEDWKAARLFFLGVSPYSAQGLAAMGESAMGHPPTTPFWYLPLAQFSKDVVVQLSTFQVWFLLPVHTYLCAKALEFRAPLATALLTASALFATHFVKYHCDATQLSEPIAVLYVVAWWSLRRGRDVLGGLCLGAALTMKLFPGVMLVMLLLARRFRALLAAILSYLAIAAFMTRAYGVDAWYEFFREQGGVSNDWLGSVHNASLSGLVVQLITPVCVAPAHASQQATLVTVACSIAFVCAAAWLCRVHFKAARQRDSRAIDLPFALFALLSVFLNAWVWDHYAVLAVQPLFILLAAFRDAWRHEYRGWCDYARSSRSLLAVSGAALGGATGIALTLKAFTLDSHQQEAIQNLWLQTRLPFYHHVLHFLQIENFSTWLVPITLCGLALPLSRRESASEPGTESS